MPPVAVPSGEYCVAAVAAGAAVADEQGAIATATAEAAEGGRPYPCFEGFGDATPAAVTAVTEEEAGVATGAAVTGDGGAQDGGLCVAAVAAGAAVAPEQTASAAVTALCGEGARKLAANVVDVPAAVAAGTAVTEEEGGIAAGAAGGRRAEFHASPSAFA